MKLEWLPLSMAVLFLLISMLMTGFTTTSNKIYDANGNVVLPARME